VNQELEEQMNISKDCYQGTRIYNKRYCFAIYSSLFTIAFLLLGSHAAFAVCVATVTATTPTADFVDNGDGTVTHSKTGLMWKRCSEGQVWSGTTCTGTASMFTWQLALQQGANATSATFTDWRLPNHKELNSIVEEQCDAPALNATIFPLITTGQYWSSSPYAGNATSAWLVNFGNGEDTISPKSGIKPVRLVRGGQ